jgi:hypothetical protein
MFPKPGCGPARCFAAGFGCGRRWGPFLLPSLSLGEGEGEGEGSQTPRKKKRKKTMTREWWRWQWTVWRVWKAGPTLDAAASSGAVRWRCAADAAAKDRRGRRIPPLPLPLPLPGTEVPTRRLKAGPKRSRSLGCRYPHSQGRPPLSLQPREHPQAQSPPMTTPRHHHHHHQHRQGTMRGAGQGPQHRAQEGWRWRSGTRRC